MAIWGWLGMDTEQARTSASGLKSHSADLGEINRDLNGLMDELDWTGPDADKFRQAWSGYSPTIGQGTGEAEENGRDLAKRADRQDEVSGMR